MHGDWRTVGTSQPTGTSSVATPNYGYEKRQKELAKKRKKEEKLKAKAERKAGVGAPAGDDDATQPGQGDEPAEPNAQPPQT